MDILTIGEVLIDLTQTGKDETRHPAVRGKSRRRTGQSGGGCFQAGRTDRLYRQGGCRCLWPLPDKRFWNENKRRCVSGMAVDADHPTTMAVVSVDATGERDFSFYRSANADVMLCKEDISDEALKAAKIVHFGSVSLTADPSRTATLDAAARAKKLGATITYDPNYRANLWKR